MSNSSSINFSVHHNSEKVRIWGNYRIPVKCNNKEMDFTISLTGTTINEIDHVMTRLGRPSEPWTMPTGAMGHDIYKKKKSPRNFSTQFLWFFSVSKSSLHWLLHYEGISWEKLLQLKVVKLGKQVPYTFTHIHYMETQWYTIWKLVCRTQSPRQTMFSWHAMMERGWFCLFS